MRLLKYVLPPLAWATLVFYLSTGAGASTHTNSFVDMFLARWFPRWSGSMTWAVRDAIHYYLRKAAHVTEYAVLGVLLARAVRFGRTAWTGRIGWSAWIIAVAYASTDEFHQRFVPGRTPKVTDVMIDAAGAAIGVLLYAMAARRQTRRGP